MPNEHWYEAPEEDCHAQVFRFVARVEQEQGDIYDRLLTLESLYDKHSPDGSLADDPRSAAELLNDMYENVVASNVDTTYASIATTEVRARLLTDGADWGTMRRAAKMELYVEGLGKLNDRHKKCRLAFREAAKKGAGLVKVTANRWDEVAVEHIPIEEIVVPDADNRSGAPPLQLHHVMRRYDRDQLKAEFPEAADEIDAYRGVTLPANAMDRGPAKTGWVHNKITVIESWRLPIGKKPAKGDRSSKGARYVPGRHTITIAHRTLLDEEYNEPHYPIAVIAWSERKGSFYPISGAERIVGIQRALNLRNWTIERMLQQNAHVTTWVRPADMGAVMRTTEVGNWVPIKGEYPKTETPPAVHPELINSRLQLKQAAADEFGQSQARVRGDIPAGLQTGAAVREYRTSSTQRYAPQEADFERLVLDVVWLEIAACRALGKLAPTVIETRWQRPIRWREVDMGQVRIQISAASTLPREAAGREQTILEWAQAGVISTDTFRRLIGHPDLESEMSMYTAALDAIDLDIEAILDGGSAVPEPYDNLKMIEWRATQRYNQIRRRAPEVILESLRDYIDQAAFLSSMQAANENAGPMPGAAGPDGAQPTAALSQQAMQLKATAAG